MKSVYEQYFGEIEKVITRIKENEMEKIDEVAMRFANCIANGGLVHMYGSGHSRMGVEEMFPRYGSFPGFHPLVELSTTMFGNVTGCNGVRQSVFIENVEGLAERMLSSVDVRSNDCFLLFSTSGTGNVVLEMAMEAKKKGCYTVGVLSVEHSAAGKSKHSSGKKLGDEVDVVLDNFTPVGDAVVWVDGLKAPVGPVSTIGMTMIVNLIKVKVAQLLTEMGQPPIVQTHAHFVGVEEGKKAFEESMRDFERRVRRGA